MALYLIFPKLVLFLSLVDKVLLVTTPRSNGIEELESKLVEIKLPLRITSADDLIVWARNAMRSMASRIDITLATEFEEESTTTTTVKPADSRSNIGPRDRNKNAARKSSRRGPPGGALVSTYASLFGEGNALAAIARKEPFEDATTRGDKKAATDEPREPNKLYLPLFLDSTEIVKYRRLNEERGRQGTNKYNRESNEASLESHLNNNVKAGGKYSRAIGPKSSRVSGNDGKTLKTFNEDTNRALISVPFEAVVTITRENVPTESARPGFQENRHPPDEFPPYLEIDDFSSGDANKKGKLDGTKKTRENSQKQPITVLGDLLRILGFGKNTANKKVNLVGGPSRSKGARKPSEIFTPPPPPQFQPEAQRQRRNETSQRQEFDDDDDDEEESMGSLGSITDLLPLVIPILEDIIDPNTATDLGEILAAALPLVQGLSDPGDEDAPDIIGMIGPILTNILGGKDGQGSDVAAILGPLVTLIAPLIGPVLGPLVGPLLGASSNPVQGGDGGANGSSLASLITAVVGPLVQPTDPGGMSPLSVLVAGVIAALSKELKPGLPGGLDVGALVGAILSGVIAGASAGLSGTLSANDPPRSAAPYGPAGPLQAGSINTGTSAGFHAPGLQQQHHHHQQQQGPIHTAGNVAAQQKIVHQTIHRPYSTLPQNIPASTQARPPPTNYAQHFHAVGPLQAGTNDGGSSYLPYGSNAVPANSVNPIGLIGSAIKDVLGAGIQVVSTVINAVFGIIGGSSAPEEPPPRPVYGPPAQGYS